MSEEKTFATINTIFNKINRDFPLNLSIANLSKRLIKNLKEKLNDVNHQLILEILKKL
jgi:hypothetical protein